MKNSYSDKDFTPECLPINRRQQFAFVFKNNWKRFLLLGFILLLFSLPLIISLLIRDLRAGELVKSNQSDLLFTNEMFFAIFIIPSYVVLFIGLSGLFRILRNYVWSEGILFRQDYLIGIKQNWLLFSLFGLVFIGSYYLFYFLSVYINVNYVRYLPFAVFVLIIAPITLIELSMASIYKNTILKYVFNSTKIYIKNMLPILISEITILLIPTVLIIAPMPLIIKYAILVIFIFAILPIMSFAFQLLSIHIFDKMINAKNHPDIYHKGLFKK